MLKCHACAKEIEVVEVEKCDIYALWICSECYSVNSAAEGDAVCSKRYEFTPMWWACFVLNFVKLFTVLICVAMFIDFLRGSDDRAKSNAIFEEIIKENETINSLVLSKCPRDWVWNCDSVTGLCQKGCR